MRAGLLEEVIYIYSAKVVTNAYGEETTSWEQTYKTRARLLHDNGARENDNDEIFYGYIKTFQVRRYVPVSEFDRIYWNNNKYRILSITPDKHQQNLTIKAELINE